MKEHIIRALLYENGDAVWKDTEVNGMVNIKLNVHQKARQFIEVELGNFILNEGEAVLASFERKVDGEFNHINPSRLNKVDGSNNNYRMQIPTEVHNIPGEWGVQFYAVTSYNKITGTYENAIAFTALYFIEGSSFLDDGLTVPSKENLQALYDAAIDAKTNAQSAAETATTAKESAQASANTATTAEANAKAYSESALASKQTAESASAVAVDSKNQVIAIKEEIDFLVPQIQENTNNIAKNTELLNAQGIAIKENETAIKNNSFEIAEVNRKSNTEISIAAANKLYTVIKVEQAYTSRETAAGKSIIDGSLAAVKEIKGRTVVDESTGTLKHAFINAIKSTGRNLIPSTYTEMPEISNGVAFTKNADGSIRVKGLCTGSSFVPLATGLMLVPNSQYTLSGYQGDADGDSRLHIDWFGVASYNDWGYSVTFNAPNTEKTATIYFHIAQGITYDITLYPMLNHGPTELPYEPYTEETYQLPETLELPEWDNIKPQTGEITRGTETITSETGFTKEEIANYDSAIVSTDGKTLAYKLATPTTRKIVNTQKTYTVHAHGNETVVQGETDNIKFGAMATISNEYFKLTEV